MGSGGGLLIKEEEEEEEMGWRNRERRKNSENDEIELRSEKGLGKLQLVKNMIL